MRMQKLMLGCVVVALAAGSGATRAAACLDVELAFDPSTASPGDAVTLFASVANLGDEAVLADIDVTITAGPISIGPIGGMLPLAAGEERSVEVVFIVPPLPGGGELTITLTATAGDCTDTATATLTIVPGGGDAAPDGLRTLAVSLLDGLGADGSTVSVEATTWADIKNLYR